MCKFQDGCSFSASSGDEGASLEGEFVLYLDLKRHLGWVAALAVLAPLEADTGEVYRAALQRATSLACAF